MQVLVVTLNDKGDQVVFFLVRLYLCRCFYTPWFLGLFQDSPVEFLSLFLSLHPPSLSLPLSWPACQSLSYYPFLYHGKGIIGATKTQLNLPVMDKSLKCLIQRVFVGTVILISIAKWS